MRKTILIGLISFSLFSCKKNSDQKIESVKTYPVSFDVSGFTSSTGPITNVLKGTNAVAPNEDANPVYTQTSFTKIFYGIYNAQGTEVSRLEEYANDPNKLYRISSGAKTLVGTNAFGSLSDNLPTGTYTIVVAAGDKSSSFNAPMSLNTTNQVYTDSFLSAPLSSSKFYVDYYGFPMYDASYYKGTLIVDGSTNAPQAIVLNRIVGKIHFVIEDAIPTNAAVADFTVNGNKSYFNIATGVAEGATNTTMGWDLSMFQGKTNWSIDLYSLNTVSDLTIKVDLFDAQFKAITTKTVTARAYVNQQTTVTGKMSTTGSPGFTIQVDPGWGTSGTTVHY